MPRFMAVLLAASACAFLYLVAAGLALPQAATARAMFVVASVALVLSAAAMAVAAVTASGSRAHAIQLQNLARSLDAALRDLAARKDDAVATRFATAQDIALRPADADRRPIEIGVAGPQAPARPARREPAAPAVAGPAAAAANRPALLRPLLLTATGAVAGFDVLPGPRRGEDAANGKAALERGLVLGAIEAASRPGFAGERNPLHVAVSEALLADQAELAAVTEALRRLNGTARVIVLSLPTGLMERPARHSAVLARLAASGPRLAAEGWPGSGPDIEALWRSGVSFLRLPAARLLPGGSPGPSDAGAVIRMLSASGMTAIATDVRSDAEACELARLGITLMTAATRYDPVRQGPGAGATARI